MNVKDALKMRKSIRSFLPQEIEKEKLETIFEYTRFTPSGVNMQPWEVAIAIGYENSEALINSYKTSRVEKESFIKYFS